MFIEVRKDVWVDSARIYMVRKKIGKDAQPDENVTVALLDIPGQTVEIASPISVVLNTLKRTQVEDATQRVSL